MLRIDLYTKAVLTVIAVCLIVLCFQSLRAPVPVYAQMASQRVVIAGVESGLKTAVPVFIAGGAQPVPVTIVGGK